MTVPKVKPGSSITKAQLIERYRKETTWEKEIEFDWVILINRIPHIQTYKYMADTIPCSKRVCAPYQMTYVRLASTGVNWHCGSCRQTDGPITSILGTPVGPPRRVTPEAAFAQLEKTGQHTPPGLEKAAGSRGFTILT